MIEYLPYPERVADGQYGDDLRRIHHQGRLVSSIQGPDCLLIPQGIHMEFPLANGFPLVTERPIRGLFYRAIGEILWMLSGSTSVDLLHKYDVYYWDNWQEPEILKRHNLDAGKFGPMYGFQFRHFGAKMERGHIVGEVGFDQLHMVVEGLRTFPERRSWLISPYNPTQYRQAALVPCHGLIHLLSVDRELYLHLWQRSGDWPLGVPANMVMWATVGELVARLTNHKFVYLTHDVSNPHYYSKQWLGVQMLLKRQPAPFPTVQFNDELVRVFEAMVFENTEDPISLNRFNPKGLTHLDFIKQHVQLTDYNPGASLPKEFLPVST